MRVHYRIFIELVAKKWRENKMWFEIIFISYRSFLNQRYLECKTIISVEHDDSQFYAFLCCVFISPAVKAMQTVVMLGSVASTHIEDVR